MPMFRAPKFVPEPRVLEPVRSAHPCGVPDCFEVVRIVYQDEKETLVECAVHEARTLWDTKPIERKEQQVIRVQDNWRQHGTAPPPRK